MTQEEALKQLKIELSIWESDCKSHHKTKDALKVAIELLEQTRWVPVSERPPKDFGTYYITLKDGDVRLYDFNPDSWIDRALLSMCAVAWMPFEPYKLEKESEE